MKIEETIKIVLKLVILVTSLIIVSTDPSKVTLENGGVILEHVKVHFKDFYAQVGPQVQIYFGTAKDFAIKFVKMCSDKTTDFIRDGMDLTYDWYFKAWALIRDGRDLAYDGYLKAWPLILNGADLVHNVYFKLWPLILDGLDLAYDGYLKLWPLILDGIDLAYDGYLKVWPLIPYVIDLAYDGYLKAWSSIKQGTKNVTELMDDEEKEYLLNFKWLAIFLALTCYGILAKPSSEVSRMGRSITRIIMVSLAAVFAIVLAFYFSFAIQNRIKIHQEIVT